MSTPTIFGTKFPADLMEYFILPTIIKNASITTFQKLTRLNKAIYTICKKYKIEVWARLASKGSNIVSVPYNHNIDFNVIYKGPINHSDYRSTQWILNNKIFKLEITSRVRIKIKMCFPYRIEPKFAIEYNIFFKPLQPKLNKILTCQSTLAKNITLRHYISKKRKSGEWTFECDIYWVLIPKCENDNFGVVELILTDDGIYEEYMYNNLKQNYEIYKGLKI